MNSDKKAFGNNTEKMNTLIRKLCKKSKVIGANIALFNNETILYDYNYGYANKEDNLKSTNESLYMIGSNTKLLTALSIFKLLENGELSLDDDIKKYIPEFEIQSTFEYEKITIENLLMHRSGLIADLYNLILDPSRDYHEVIDELKNTYLTFIPGQVFSYSNVGYTLLGIIIERISGLKYAEYIKRIIAQPLGINIHFLKCDDEKKSFASCMSLNYTKYGEPVEELTTTMLPAGSNTYMSINDFVKLGQLFLNKDIILKKSTFELMEKLNVPEQIDNDLFNVGYGLIHNNYNFDKAVGKVLGHGGDTIFHHSVFNYIPSLNIGIVAVTNSEQGAALSKTLALTIFTEYLKSKGYDTNFSVEHKPANINYEKYIGKYVTGVGLLEIDKNNKGELISTVSKYPVKLIPCEDEFLQCYPNKWILKLPSVKKAIKGIRIKGINYFNNEVLIIEQTSSNNKTLNILGCRYSETLIPNTFKNACGYYEVTNIKREYIDCKILLSVEDDILKLEFGLRDLKIVFCLTVIDDNTAVTQGIGKYAKEIVQISKDKDDVYLAYNGLNCKRVK